MTPTFVTGKPKLWLRLDGLVLFIGSVLLFAGQQQEWWLYPLLLFVPDIFMVGYLKNTRAGAALYNIGHSYLAPTLMTLSGWYRVDPFTIAVGLIWFGHVGFDRFFGFGLKYDSDFKHTHLGDLAKPKN